MGEYNELLKNHIVFLTFELQGNRLEYLFFKAPALCLPLPYIAAGSSTCVRSLLVKMSHGMGQAKEYSCITASRYHLP